MIRRLGIVCLCLATIGTGYRIGKHAAMPAEAQITWLAGRASCPSGYMLATNGSTQLQRCVAQ